MSYSWIRKVMPGCARSAMAIAAGLASTLFLLFTAGHAAATVSIQAVDTSRLRVCASPSNLPFSNEKGQGFENKIAELLAKKLGRPLVYDWRAQMNQYIRYTLNAKACDLIIGINAVSDAVLNTNPYYRTTYVMVYPKSLGLHLKGLDDPIIKEKKLVIGTIAGTPPNFLLSTYGLLDQIHPYPLHYNPFVVSIGQKMIEELKSGVTQIALMSSPLAGYWAKQEGLDATIVPLKSINQQTGKMDFYITMGVRHGENDWKRQINVLIQQNQDEINKILRDYGIMLLQMRGEPVPLDASVSEKPGK
jgi:quinoprotein dehydrogenase-associated probable ABC transporter substrate-binding protein